MSRRTYTPKKFHFVGYGLFGLIYMIILAMQGQSATQARKSKRLVNRGRRMSWRLK